MSLQVVHILQNSQNLNTKFFALQLLESVIKYRWNALLVEQCDDGIKNYISYVIVEDENHKSIYPSVHTIYTRLE
jgi:exportin-1